MAETATLKLNSEAYRMAQSMLRLIRHVARRDAKAEASLRPKRAIFPSTDSTLQAALVTVTNRLELVINQS